MESKLEKANSLITKKVEYTVCHGADTTKVTATALSAKICDDRVLVYLDNNHSINYDIIREVLETPVISEVVETTLNEVKDDTTEPV